MVPLCCPFECSQTLALMTLRSGAAVRTGRAICESIGAGGGMGTGGTGIGACGRMQTQPASRLSVSERAASLTTAFIAIVPVSLELLDFVPFFVVELEMLDDIVVVHQADVAVVVVFGHRRADPHFAGVAQVDR